MQDEKKICFFNNGPSFLFEEAKSLEFWTPVRKYVKITASKECAHTSIYSLYSLDHMKVPGFSACLPTSFQQPFIALWHLFTKADTSYTISNMGQLSKSFQLQKWEVSWLVRPVIEDPKSFLFSGMKFATQKFSALIFVKSCACSALLQEIGK